MRIEVVPANDEAQLEYAGARATEVLEAGGLVVHPTETVYGIGGDGSAGNNRLIARVKRRQPLQPLILLSPDIDALSAAFPGLEWPEEADVLARAFWPGPLTIVARCPGAPEGVLGEGDGIAVRVSPDRTVTSIMTRWRRPMTSTSANLAGEAPARTVGQALAIFGEREDLADIGCPVVALDAGPTTGTRASTIVSCAGSPPRLIREGPVSREQIRALLPELE